MARSGNLSPVIKSDIPGFNQRAADRAAELVMKMSPEEAYGFTTLVVSDLLERDIEGNLRTLQNHLNGCVSKRLEKIKKAALDSTVSKGATPEAVAFAKAITDIEKALNPYDYGYRFQESDFRRDPRSGRFTTKIRHTQTRPLSGKQAQGQGIPVPPTTASSRKLSGGKRPLTREERAQYQDEYKQIANFLEAVTASTDQPGNTKVLLHVQNKRTGQQHSKVLNGTSINTGDWDPANEVVTHVEAQPEGLTLGGAAFGVIPGLSSTGVKRINATDEAMPTLAQEWNAEHSAYNSNSRLYNRITAGSNFLAAVGVNSPHAQIAAKFGQFVGSRGPEAEEVLGPYARKLSYRYRGTERALAPEAKDQYEIVVRGANKPGFDADDQRQINRLAKIEETKIKARKAEAHNKANPKRPIDPTQMQLTRAERALALQTATDRVKAKQSAGPISDAARRAGEVALVSYLHQEGVRPEKRLYGLHLDAGNTPPSEGFIIDKDGQVVTQAIGYGDDHYLPFNLKHLSALKGGSYVRSRSVGGPTSEDIYTGLVSGARELTVTSRSGNFKVIFKDDFRGGRRHNDKARRMVRRYEQLLDSVQSQKVDKEQLSPNVERAIRFQVNRDMGAWPKADRDRVITRKIEEFKENPEITPEREALIDNYVNAVTQDLPEAQRNRIAGEVRRDFHADAEVKFKLDGEGYAAALKALQEQFPYYIESISEPRQDPEHFSSNIDRGYVEPGRNRPTGASAGWHGTREGDSTKFSARGANFQRGIYGTKGKFSPVTVHSKTPKKPEAATQVGGAPTAAPAGEKATPEAEAKAPVQSVEQKAAEQAKFAEANKPLMEKIANAAEWNEQARQAFPFLDPAKAADHDLADPVNAEKFDRFMRVEGPSIVENGFITAAELDAYNKTSARLGRVEWDPALGLNEDAKPFLFPGQVYTEDASPDDQETEATRLNAFMPVSARGRVLSTMQEPELKEEIKGLKRLANALKATEGEENVERRNERIKGLTWQDLNDRPGVPQILRAPDPQARIKDHIESVQRMRSLNVHRTPPKPEPTVLHSHLNEDEGKQRTVELSDQQQDLLNKAEMVRIARRRLEALPARSPEANEVLKDLQAIHENLRSMAARPGVGFDQDAYEIAVDETDNALREAWKHLPKPNSGELGQ